MIKEIQSMLSRKQADLAATVARKKAVLAEWKKTGLLEGLNETAAREMATLFENQLNDNASRLLTESGTSISTGAASLTSSGMFAGYTTMTLPMVRRVFAGLVASNAISVQAISTNTGLVFYLDFTFGDDRGGEETDDSAAYVKGRSIFGAPTGSTRRGVEAVGGQYNLQGAGYSKVHRQADLDGSEILFVGAFAGEQTLQENELLTTAGRDATLLEFDPRLTDLIDQGYAFQLCIVDLTTVVGGAAKYRHADLTQQIDMTLFAQRDGSGAVAATGLEEVAKPLQDSRGLLNYRTATKIGKVVRVGGSVVGFTPDPYVSVTDTDAAAMFVVSPELDGSGNPLEVENLALSYILKSAFVQQDGSTVLVPTAESDLEPVPQPSINSITMKLSSESVTAEWRKLRASWTVEAAQTFNSHFGIDIDQTMTEHLSKHTAIEIESEILNDLFNGATGARYYWSKRLGEGVNVETGVPQRVQITASADGTGELPYRFTGTQQEWYSGLINVMSQAATQSEYKTNMGSPNVAIAGVLAAQVLAATGRYAATTSVGATGYEFPMKAGVTFEGAIDGLFTVYKSKQLMPNVILLAYKGTNGDGLETGYVLAPWVPIVLTGLVTRPEDFNPTRGVMTAYAKKMIRGDMYATVTIKGINVT